MTFPVRPIAFYLPQFHPIRENSEWWGEGFTEWTNVAKAKPIFDGHYQPHVPRDLGFYDLRMPEVMYEQAGLATLYGIYGFCFYYYWFNGRRILELPLANWLRSSIDFPFCLCWANENWTRRWDGDDSQVLLAQQHSDDDDREFFRSILPALNDTRYIRVDNRPMLIVYRATLFPDPARTAATWRREAIAAGLPGLHLCAVQFYGIDDPREFGFDAAIEFPPHKFLGSENRPFELPRIYNPLFNGGIADYRKIIAQSIEQNSKDYVWYRGIMPSWDNTPRRQNNPHIVLGSTPELYEYWLSYLIRSTAKHNRERDRFIFINAWNEWGEGCHLEPDVRNGLKYLEVTLRAQYDATGELQDVPDELTAARDVTVAQLISNVLSLSEENRALRLRVSQLEEKRFEASMRIRIARRLERSPGLYRVARRVYRTFASAR